MTRYFKILVDGKSCHGGNSTWHMPEGDKPGKWMPSIRGLLIHCERGYHIVQAHQIPHWLKENCQIFEVEYSGELVEENDKSVCRKIRIIKQMNWDNALYPRLFAADCAEHVLHIYEQYYPDDDRPRKAIDAARKYARKKIDSAELDAAWSAARDAALAVAWAAARDAAWSAARDAAWSAAEAAARDAAWAVAWAAARDAAWSAGAAAWDAELDAACAAEQIWQGVRLLEYLDGKIA